MFGNAAYPVQLLRFHAIITGALFFKGSLIEFFPWLHNCVSGSNLPLRMACIMHTVAQWPTFSGGRFQKPGGGVSDMDFISVCVCLVYLFLYLSVIFTVFWQEQLWLRYCYAAVDEPVHDGPVFSGGLRYYFSPVLLVLTCDYSQCTSRGQPTFPYYPYYHCAILFLIDCCYIKWRQHFCSAWI